jgi:phosphonate transport system substrate-binding protein
VVASLARLVEPGGGDAALRHRSRHPDLERRLGGGSYDIAYMNPFHYTVAADRFGWRAFARDGGQGISGILVTRDDAPYTSIRELGGAEIAFPSPAAFAATLITTAELTAQGIPFSTRFIGSHDSVYLGVRDHLFAAGGGIRRTFEMVDEAIRAPLRILWSSPAYTPHAFAAHPRIATGLREQVGRALLAAAASPEGRTALAAVGIPTLAAAEDATWNDVRQLRIPLDQFAGA